jgi:Tfp pilus assembly protein PilF
VIKPTSDGDDEDLLNTATLLSRCGWFLDLQGAYEEAEAMHRRALEVREMVLGCKHLSTLTSVSNLGSVLDSQGKSAQAEAMY